jgi:uncharacterized BrkB/YihY/UPF0761 family membrane protein
LEDVIAISLAGGALWTFLWGMRRIVQGKGDEPGSLERTDWTQRKPQASRLGFVAFVLGLLEVLLFYPVLVVDGKLFGMKLVLYLGEVIAFLKNDPYPFQEPLLPFFLFLCISLIPVPLGLASLAERQRKKRYAIWGIVLSLLSVGIFLWLAYSLRAILVIDPII